MANATIGIGLMLISTTLMNVGTVMQKKAVDKLPPMEQETLGKNIKGILSNKLWLLGWIQTTLAMLLNMIALGQADITVIQPLTGFGLVVLVIFSHYYLDEKVTKMEISGITVAIIGVVILGLTASESNEFTTLENVMSNYLQPNCWIILGILFVIIAAMWIGTRKADYKGAGIIFAIISAMFSVVGLTFSKGAFSIIDIFGLFPSLAVWQTYVLLVCFITCSTMAMALQQLSLQKGKSIVVTPVFNLMSIILPLATGYMVFSEQIGWPKIVGILIILVGTVLLSIKKESLEAFKETNYNKKRNQTFNTEKNEKICEEETEKVDSSEILDSSVSMD